jgi:hypothetical protein
MTVKIEIEIDEQKITEAVVAKIHETLIWQAKQDVEKMVKQEVVQSVRIVARETINGILNAYTLPDGRTFKKYVSDLFERAVSYGERPRVTTMVEEILNNYARHIYVELVEPHAKAFKEDLKKKLADHVFA